MNSLLSSGFPLIIAWVGSGALGFLFLALGVYKLSPRLLPDDRSERFLAGFLFVMMCFFGPVAVATAIVVVPVFVIVSLFQKRD